MVFKKAIILNLLLFPCAIYASFIESTMGTAVVNDATAVFHNPAALTLVKKSQIVALGTKASSSSQFIGQSIERIGWVSQTGVAKERTDFNLPSGYLTFPVRKKLKLGFALLRDKLNSDIDEPSILRYDQANNKINNTDYIFGAAFKTNKYWSLGAGLTYSAARFTSDRITGFPNLDVPDSQSHDRTKGSNFGWNVGFLIKPEKSTLVGFNYRSQVSYLFKGKSEFAGPPHLLSSDFDFSFWTPARSVATLSHFISPSLGFITTAQYVQWSVFKNVKMHNLATQVGQNAFIIPSVLIPYHFKDSWILTIGGIKKIKKDWVLRAACTYNQSPGNGFYRLTSGDDIILGVSTGYNLRKNLILDAGYAHAFTQNQAIDIATLRKLVIGVNKVYRDSLSLKLTLSI